MQQNDSVDKLSPEKDVAIKPQEISKIIQSLFPKVKKDCEDFLETYRQQEDDVRGFLSSKVPMADIEFVANLTMIRQWGTCKQETENILKRLMRLIPPKKNKHYGEAMDAGVTATDIAKAKEYPIRDLVEVNRGNKTTCLWHSPDKNPSLHLFKDNHVHCFSCAKSGDAIDVYMAIHSCDFVTAVRGLI